MNNIEIHREIVKVADEKEKHLNEYRKAIETLAKNESEFMFVSGECKQCDDYDERIKQLEKMLVI